MKEQTKGQITQLTWRQTNELKPHPFNKEMFGELREEQKEILRRSISENGVFHPVLITKNGTVLSGYHRWLTAKEMELEKLPCNVIDIDPDSDQAKKIIIEANMGQRILAPEEYRRCWDQYEKISQKRVENLQLKLIPELWGALKEGKLQVHLAYAMAGFPKEEQKNFLALVGAKIKEANHAKASILKEALAEANQKIAVKEEEIAGLKEKVEKIRNEKEKTKARLERLIYDKERLIKKINQSENEIECLRRNPPSKTDEIEQKQKQIDILKKQLKDKDSVVDLLKLQMDEYKENADNLYLELEKERQAQKQAKIKLEGEFNNRLNEKMRIYKEKEQEKREKDTTNGFAPLETRYSALLDFMIGTLEEIIGNAEQLKQRNKQILIEKLGLLKAQAGNAADALSNKFVAYEYEEGN